MITLNDSNIVLIAKNLNPSIFSQLWLVKQGIIFENEFKQGSFFTPPAVNILTEVFSLLVVPERLQLAFFKHEHEWEIAKRVIGVVVESLPHTPYTAIGFNFNWSIEPGNEKEFPSNLKRLFLSGKNPLAKDFDVDDARFGIYMSKNIIDMRLKLDIKPVIMTSPVNKEFLQLNFNFHKDVKDDAVRIIIETLSNFTIAADMSKEMVVEVSKGWA
jgi:hypothetical protein